MNTNIPKKSQSLRKRLSTVTKKAFNTAEPQAQGAQVVLDRQIFVQRGMCRDGCTLTITRYTGCSHDVVTGAQMCQEHAGLPQGLPGINVNPTVEPQEGVCQPCSLRTTEENKLDLFERIRDLGKKKWGKLKTREEELLDMGDKALEMGQEAWNEYKASKMAEIAENARISGLSSQEAKTEQDALEAQIAHLTPRDQLNLAVR